MNSVINVATYFETSFKIHKIHLIRHKANYTAYKFVHVHKYDNGHMNTRICHIVYFIVRL
jgi:hypothetical protein